MVFVIAVVSLLQKTAPPTEQVKRDQRLNASGCGGGVFLAGVVMVMLCFYCWWCKLWWWFVCVVIVLFLVCCFFAIKICQMQNVTGDCFTVAIEDWPRKVWSFYLVVVVFLLLVMVMVLVFLLSVVMMVILWKCCFGVVVVVVFLLCCPMVVFRFGRRYKRYQKQLEFRCRVQLGEGASCKVRQLEIHRLKCRSVL